MRVDFVYKELFFNFSITSSLGKGLHFNQRQSFATQYNQSQSPPLTLLCRLVAWQAIKMFIQSLRQGIEGLHIVALQLILSCYGDIVYT